MNRRLQTLWIAFLVFLLMVLAVPAFAGKVDQTLNSDVQDNDLIRGDTAIGLGIPGLGDVDINDCMASEQWTLLLGGKQRLVLNKWCASLYYDQIGQHDTAARLRCTIEEIAELFPEGGCLDANVVVALPPPPAPAMREDEDEELDAEDVQEIVAQAIAEEVKRQPKPKPVKIERVIEQQPYLIPKELADQLRVTK